MKKLVMIAVLILTVPSAAHADRQVYGRNPRGAIVDQQELLAARQAQLMQQQQIGTKRVYPGREAYGTNFGPMPRHPGDYRDAVDRGTWTGGGGGQRSFPTYN